MIKNRKTNIEGRDSKIESTKEIQGQMTDAEIKSELMKNNEFLAALELAKGDFENYWKDFQDSDSFKTLKESYSAVIDKVDFTNIPLGLAQKICFDNGVEVYKHNLINPDDPWSYGFSFPKESMFKFFANAVERRCLKEVRKQGLKGFMA